MISFSPEIDWNNYFTVDKFSFNKNEYEKLLMKNGLTILLSTTKSPDFGISLGIKSLGDYNDPPELQGLS